MLGSGARPARHLRDALAVLRARGLRVSSARRLVLYALTVADGPMSAEQIAGGIGGRVPRSDLATVYRNLETLEAAGVVQHVHLGHGPGLYVLRDREPREFVTCHRCGDYRAIDPAELDDVRAVLRRRFGIAASFTHFPIVGLCASCVSSAPAVPPGPQIQEG
jgi:Fur family ferric uptake transcriptional regulator